MLERKQRTRAPRLPRLCAHRIVGDETNELGTDLPDALNLLVKKGIDCFDVDVVRLKDGAIFVGHPLMFQAHVETKLGTTFDEASPTRSRDVLLQAEAMTLAEYHAANASVPDAAVRPVRLRRLLAAFADVVKGIAASDFAPRLFIEVKNAGYTSDNVHIIWAAIEELDIAQNVALWAMDKAHHDVLKSVADGRVNVIWSYNDMDFADVLSTVPFPAPVPPEVEDVHMFGIAKRAPVRFATEQLGADAMIVIWLIDTVVELAEVCREGADMIVTNRPLMLLQASQAVAAQCVTGV